MARKRKKNNGKQQNTKDNDSTSKSGLWQILIPVLGTIVAAYLSYLGIVTVPRLSIEATQTAQVQNLAFTQTAFALLPPPTSTSTATPAYTFTPTPTLTFTLTPSVTPSKTLTPSPTATSTPRPLHANCIDPQTWTPDSTDLDALAVITPGADGCSSMESLGIFTDETGKLYLNYRDRKTAIATGIHTPIRNNSVIEFKVYVNSMYIVYRENPAYVSFAVAPENDPMTARNTARFKLQVVDTGTRPVIHFVLADVGESNGTEVGSRHYEYGWTYTIRLELVGNLMRVYINGSKMDETLLIPTGPKVFYIGYNVPIRPGVDMKVSDITVNGVPK